MTYKVVVIDDKPLIRQAIVQTIAWDKLNCTVVGQAEDGIEGQRLITELQPDILVTDIKMPGLSGLDLAEQMSTGFPLAKTILITGYQDFEYAKRAVRLGVFDFIVKPINYEELSRVIGGAVEEIDNKRRENEHTVKITSAFVELEKQHIDAMPSLRSKLIGDLITGTDDMQEQVKKLDILYSRYVVQIVRTANRSDQSSAANAVKYKQQMQLRLSEQAHELTAKRDFYVIESLRNNDLIFVCLFPKVMSQREYRMKLQNFCNEFIDIAHVGEQISCQIAVSSVYKSLLELPEAFREASMIMDSSFFRMEESVLFPDHNQQEKELGKYSIIQDLEQFNQMLEDKSSEDVMAYLERFLQQITAYSEGNILVVKGLLSEVCLAVARYYFRVTGDEFGLGKSIDQILEDVYRLTSMKEASTYLTTFIGTIKKKLEGGDKVYSLVVKKVIDYINSHIADTINLTSTAEHFGLSSSYLSRLLRTETGINFVDLVSKARIETAKRLLMDPKNKVNEVGEMVGYKEYAYFYQVFKRLEGQSPKEYKNRGKEI
ncbi:Protein-glutamate methylesterase/protein-glutamine glutaminase [Paenibacillus allorhizoplanae]|uniref:Protein-glutamate methylesterase/protein-glutamine glutaminase n=1 Tax=Paenibacillus allorhizoplanae TaxID=2905648 RepID=A0ABN8H3P3_9BACL|nr:response regulator [Paenibacillus allorhizoplanae]CAH1226286.1 Protein-glutamate methylesterase/protein-glutamine glutaminase [Paenibacillus allorhizoplanae]